MLLGRNWIPHRRPSALCTSTLSHKQSSTAHPQNAAMLDAAVYSAKPDGLLSHVALSTWGAIAVR